MGQANGGPRARTNRLLVEQVDDEVVVYDLDTDYAHLLNATTAAVWRRCDGTSSVQAIARTVAADSGVAFDEAIVLDALHQLHRAALLESFETPRSRGLSRRQLLKAAGIAAVTVPVVTTVLAPTPASAASSGAPIGAACTRTSQQTGNCECASGNCQKCVAQGGSNCMACSNSGADCHCGPCNASWLASPSCPGKESAFVNAAQPPCTSGPLGSTCNTTTGNCN